MEAEPPKETTAVDADAAELDQLLRVLRAVEGVSEVGDYPKARFNPKRLNDNGVKCRIFSSAGDELSRTDPKNNVHCGE